MKMRGPSRTRKERYEIFARLVLNGGNVRRTAMDLGLQRIAVYKILRAHRDEFEEVKADIKAELLAEVAEVRRAALVATKESIGLSRVIMRDGDKRGTIRSVDMAKTFEILDRVARYLGEEGGDGSAAGADDPDNGAEDKRDADVAAILGE